MRRSPIGSPGDPRYPAVPAGLEVGRCGRRRGVVQSPAQQTYWNCSRRSPPLPMLVGSEFVPIAEFQLARLRLMAGAGVLGLSVLEQRP